MLSIIVGLALSAAASADGTAAETGGDHLEADIALAWNIEGAANTRRAPRSAGLVGLRAAHPV